MHRTTYMGSAALNPLVKKMVPCVKSRVKASARMFWEWFIRLNWGLKNLSTRLVYMKLPVTSSAACPRMAKLVQARLPVAVRLSKLRQFPQTDTRKARGFSK